MTLTLEDGLDCLGLGSVYQHDTLTILSHVPSRGVSVPSPIFLPGGLCLWGISIQGSLSRGRSLCTEIPQELEK